MDNLEKRQRSLKAGGPTVNDVARLANVSTATVSRALTNSKLVAFPTRTRVEEAARQLGYAASSNRRATTLTRTVLILIPRLGSAFFTAFLHAATDLLAESGYCVAVGDLRGSTRKEALYAQALREGQFAGAILSTGCIPGGKKTALKLPTVLACNDVPGAEDLPLFDVANREAARQIVSYLVGIGHRRIAHVCGPLQNIEASERHAGFVEAMDAAGLEVDSNLIWEGNFYLRSGLAAAGRFLACAERPTAVFAGNDLMAMGFITELKAAGISVPDEVSVAGFDDIEYSSIFDPALTTMRQPKAEIGRQAAIELLRQMNGADVTERVSRIRSSCDLMIRNSTIPLRRGANEDATTTVSPRKSRLLVRPDSAEFGDF
jgi:LacI family transcriptional regulator, repressor for deo operon, udp, cdd, tsx, nupC, and nupG